MSIAGKKNSTNSMCYHLRVCMCNKCSKENFCSLRIKSKSNTKQKCIQQKYHTDKLVTNKTTHIIQKLFLFDHTQKEKLCKRHLVNFCYGKLFFFYDDAVFFMYNYTKEFIEWCLLK